MPLMVCRAPSFPVKPNPSGRNTPPSDSSISTCLSSSPRCESRYAIPPRPPFSSFVNRITRTVRRARRLSFFMRRSASQVTTHPPPSSVAPAPTSHESR